MMGFVGASCGMATPYIDYFLIWKEHLVVWQPHILIISLFGRSFLWYGNHIYLSMPLCTQASGRYKHGGEGFTGRAYCGCDLHRCGWSTGIHHGHAD